MACEPQKVGHPSGLYSSVAELMEDGKAPAVRDDDLAAGRLPARDHLVIRDGYVITMDPMVGDLPQVDVLVRNGEILAVGKDFSAEGAWGKTL